ncbi:MAG: peroxiredoxin [Streptococcaceae bacterium]|jgi:thiol peroxidase|nr:peroxiredoxin [Streptococcaceae bacterium]
MKEKKKWSKRMIITRNGETFDEINPITSGLAPDFTLRDQNQKAVRLSETPSPTIISVFPDINTDVCSLQTKRFNVEAAAHQGISFLSISNNTAEEQANWCASENVEMTVLSDTDNAFGSRYGLLMPQVKRLARSVYVVKNGEIIYSQILSEITDEPDYAQVLAVAQAAL